MYAATSVNQTHLLLFSAFHVSIAKRIELLSQTQSSSQVGALLALLYPPQSIHLERRTVGNKF